MSCGCPKGATSGDAYAACAGVPQAAQYAPDSVLQNIAASAGATSADWTMCVAMAFLKTRRWIYWKVNPGDCGTSAIDISGLTAQEAQLEQLGKSPAASSVPVLGPILSGLSSIFGVFTQAHIQAVQTEETTLCQLSTRYNQFIVQIEQAVVSGKLSPSDAGAFMDQLVSQLVPILKGIAKVCCSVGRCDAACGYTFALYALQTYNKQYVFPALAPSVSNLEGILTPTVPASAGAPGSSAPPGAYQGASGYTPAPLTSAQPTILPTSISLPSGNEGLILVAGGLLAARALG